MHVKQTSSKSESTYRLSKTQGHFFIFCEKYRILWKNKTKLLFKNKLWSFKVKTCCCFSVQKWLPKLADHFEEEWWGHFLCSGPHNHRAVKRAHLSHLSRLRTCVLSFFSLPSSLPPPPLPLSSCCTHFLVFSSSCLSSSFYPSTLPTSHPSSRLLFTSCSCTASLSQGFHVTTLSLQWGNSPT